jgi:hypothetical protein
MDKKPKFLIGSRALHYYGRLYDREPADWDFLTFNEKRSYTDGNGYKIEFISSQDASSPTNWDLYKYCLDHAKQQVYTPVTDPVFVAPLEVLKVLKLSCKDHLAKAKHTWDLNHMDDIKLDSFMIDVAVARELEVKHRVEKQKSEFFNKYNITRYFEHDYLHTLIKDTPTYTKLLKDNHPVEIDQDKFNKACQEERIALIREECFILALERDFIPKVKKAPFLVRVFAKQFLQVEISSDPALLWLSRLSVPGRLKDHDEWAAKWAMKNYKDIANGFEQWWKESFERIPVEFWKELLK